MTRDALPWHDRDACFEWLRALEASARDLIAVAEDATRAPGARDLGRRLAATLTAESASAIEALLEHARAGLEDDEPESGDPAGSGGAGPTH